MYGLSQAASYYGIQLTGLHLDAGQLKPNDIVLLNINGNNHYALILGKLGNNYIIQDPFLGTVVMTTEQFNKYYTGNALTTNPNGRGTTLSIEEMKGLFGGVGEVEVATGIGTGLMGVGAGFSWTGVGLILLAVGAVIVAGVAIYKANEHYSQKYPELNKPLPSYAPFGYKLSMGIALDVAHWLDGPAKGWTTRQVKQYKEDVEFLKNIGSGGGGGKIPKIIEEVAKVARNIPEMSLPYKIAAYLLIGSLPTYYMLKNIPKPKIFEGIAKPVVKVMGNILDIAVNAVNKTIGKLKPIKVPKGLGAGASGKLKPVKISKSSAKMVKAVANAGIKFVKSFSNAFRR